LIQAATAASVAGHTEPGAVSGIPEPYCGSLDDVIVSLR